MLDRIAVSSLCFLVASCGSLQIAGPTTTATMDASMARGQDPQQAASPAWSCNATIIEACSCPMFCQCYFSDKPASHPGCCPPGTNPGDAPRYCRFNNAY